MEDMNIHENAPIFNQNEAVPASQQTPRPQSLPRTTSRIADSENIDQNIQNARNEAPANSALRGVVDNINIEVKEVSRGATIGRSFFGVSAQELKNNFRSAIHSDKIHSVPVQWLKGAGRITGLVIGVAINLMSRVVSFAVAAAISPLVMLSYSIGGLFHGKESKIWADPKLALKAIFTTGLTVGAGAGALMGSLGSLLIKHSLNMKLENGVFTRSFEDNAGAAALGAAVGSGIALINPLLWRAAYVNKMTNNEQ